MFPGDQIQIKKGPFGGIYIKANVPQGRLRITLNRRLTEFEFTPDDEYGNSPRIQLSDKNFPVYSVILFKKSREPDFYQRRDTPGRRRNNTGFFHACPVEQRNSLVAAMGDFYSRSNNIPSQFRDRVKRAIRVVIKDSSNIGR